MAEAFTAGVKPGGLTDDTQIRILLCYLVKTAGPLTRDTLQGALLQEQLVNYFEFADAVDHSMIGDNYRSGAREKVLTLSAQYINNK